MSDNANPGGWPDGARPGVPDHERIWLEPEDGSDPDTGRMWCQHPAPGLNDDRTWTEYVRADLVAARVAEARQDDPQWDATDAAHPAWWRGNDHGVEAVVRIVNEVLDGKSPGTHGSPTLTAMVKRVEEARADALREAAAVAKRMFPHPTHDYYCDSCKDGYTHPGGEELADAILAAIPEKQP